MRVCVGRRRASGWRAPVLACTLEGVDISMGVLYVCVCLIAAVPMHALSGIGLPLAPPRTAASGGSEAQEARRAAMWQSHRRARAWHGVGFMLVGWHVSVSASGIAESPTDSQDRRALGLDDARCGPRHSRPRRWRWRPGPWVLGSWRLFVAPLMVAGAFRAALGGDMSKRGCWPCARPSAAAPLSLVLLRSSRVRLLFEGAACLPLRRRAVRGHSFSYDLPGCYSHGVPKSLQDGGGVPESRSPFKVVEVCHGARATESRGPLNVVTKSSPANPAFVPKSSEKAVAVQSVDFVRLAATCYRNCHET